MHYTHGMTGTAEYFAWQRLIQRCTNRNNPQFKNYGARGITVCGEWRKFESFYAAMGDRPSQSHRVERVNTNSDYKPSNCVWALPYQQNRNKRTNRHLTWDGRTQCAADWAKESGLGIKTVLCRLARGVTFPELIQQPIPSRKYVVKSITHQGVTRTQTGWAKHLGLSTFTLSKRLQSGWSLDRALRSGDCRGEANKARTKLA